MRPQRQPPRLLRRKQRQARQAERADVGAGFLLMYVQVLVERQLGERAKAA